MHNIPNRQVICDVLMETSKTDKDIIVLCSDSRGSASLTNYANTYPEQFVEVGIAEQSLVSVAAGMARCGKKSFAASPACFLSTRSMEQVKVDVAYSDTNVKLIGISGGVSYGALGMTHHSTQDIATMGSIPGMRVYIPSDRHQTRLLMEQLVLDNKPAYIRVGRNPVEDVYEENQVPFRMDSATKLSEGRDITIIACGEMVNVAKKAFPLLLQRGIQATVLDMYCIKPLDKAAIIEAAKNTKAIITIEEHSYFGGLGSMVGQIILEHCPKKLISMSLPDSPVVTGNSKEIFSHYGLTPEGIVETALELMKDVK